MTRHGKYEPGEDELPEGWEPEHDRDARWDGMVDLLRQADSPDMPTPSSFEVMKFETRRRLLEEGLINLNETRPSERPQELGFREWVRLLLSGGGLPAQTLRLGFVGCGAFALGVNFFASGPVGSLEARTGTAPAVPAIAEVSPSTVSDPLVAPDEVAAAEPVRRGNLPPQGFAVERGWDRASMGAPMNSLGLMQVPPSAALTVSASQQPLPGRALASQAIDQLQVLKVDSLVSQDQRKMADLRRIERTLAQLMAGLESGSVPEVEAVNLYRRAEQYLSVGRYHEAQEILQQVATLDPGSSLAYLAQFQTGWVAFEKTHDYRLAEQCFRRCLQNYPDLSERHRSWLADRVQLIEETSGEQWATLAAWQQVDDSTTNEEASRRLMSVLRDTTSPLLASRAGLALRDLLVDDSMRRDLEHAPIMAAMRERLATLPPGDAAARLQFAIAEVVAQRLQNPGEAIVEYQRAAALQPGAQTAQAIESRLTSLHLSRSGL